MKKKIMVIFIAIAVLIAFAAPSVKASFNALHILRGEFYDGASNLKYWYDSSVSGYGYRSHFEHGMANWDALSSQVNLTEQTSASGADIKIYVGYKNLGYGQLGATDFWRYNWLGQVEQLTVNQVEAGDKFDQARVRMDSYEMNYFGANTWGKNVKITAHEVGHTLSMYHFENSEPITTPAHTDTTSWMYTNKYPNPITDSPYPSVDDKEHLVSKWGN